MDFTQELAQSTIKYLKNGKTRSQVAKSAIRKGKSGERKITKILNKISGLNFERIPNSGARLGKSNRDKIYHISANQLDAFLGDIFPPLELNNRLIVESKNYKTLSWTQLKKGKIPAKLKGWIGEICYDTETYLMSKYTRYPISFLAFNITGDNNVGEGLWICYNTGHFLKNNITNFKAVYNITIPIESQLLIDHHFNDNWNIELLKEFCENNKDTLFV